MTTITDQSQDVNLQKLHAIDTAYGLPAFVKNAAHTQLYDNGQLEPHMFADVTRRLFPCHTAPATWVSAGFFFQKRAEYTKAAAELVEQRIKDSAVHFGITKQVNEIAEKIAAANIVDETALPDSVFAIVMEYANGNKERQYPMRNANEVKVAADYVATYRSQLTYCDRQKIANKILEKSAEFGANINDNRDMLERMSGIGMCAAKTAASLIRSRIPYMKLTDGKLATEFEKLAATFEKNAVEQIWPSYGQLAEVIDNVDRNFHLTGLYGKQLEYPEDVLFSVTTKVAAEQANELIGTLTGNYYKKADLKRMPVHLLSDALGDDFANEVATANAWLDLEKLAEIAPTLPRGDAELFDAAVMEAGIQPFATKTATETKQLSSNDVEEFAVQHTAPTPGGLWAGLHE